MKASYPVPNTGLLQALKLKLYKVFTDWGSGGRGRKTTTLIQTTSLSTEDKISSQTKKTVKPKAMRMPLSTALAISTSFNYVLLL